jgi:Spy/CpxP family protein refolding chaperone
VQQAARELQESLANKDAASDDVKAKLSALREARSKLQADLNKAQDQLREVLTARQEAVLVMAGMLN